MNIALEIQLVAVVVAVACSLPGVFLVLRRMALMSDAITHTVLLGIVLAFFLTHNIASPLLVLGAAAMGVITVALVELLLKTRLVREDASIGLVFPALFSIAVILISRYAGSVHLDTDAVLLGEIAFAPFRRLEMGGMDLGPRRSGSWAGCCSSTSCSSRCSTRSSSCQRSIPGWRRRWASPPRCCTTGS
jgi:manganese/zinc/iron transport system permease protein